MSRVAIVWSLILVGVFAATDSYGIRWRGGASRPASGSEGRPTLWWATTYNGIAVGSLLLAALARTATYQHVGDVALSGFVLVALAGALRVWSVAHLRDDFTFYVTDRPKGVLVATGPYAWTRHPIYFAQLGFGLGLLLIGRVWTLGILLVILVPVLRLLQRREDDQLHRQFGDAFLAYRARTPGLEVPGWCRAGRVSTPGPAGSSAGPHGEDGAAA